MPLERLVGQPVIFKKLKTPGILSFPPASLSALPGFLLCLLTSLSASSAAVPDTNTPPPLSWVDPDTGHRVIRLTREPGSDSFYFNDNAFTPDGKRMVYTTPDGISLLNLETKETQQVVTGHAHTIIVAHKSATLYYTRTDTNRLVSTLWSVNLDTGENRKITELPRRANISAINADETLGAGTFIEGDANAGGAYDGTRPKEAISDVNMGEPADKGEMMAKRLAAKLPMTLFTIDLHTGKTKTLLETAPTG